MEGDFLCVFLAARHTPTGRLIRVLIEKSFNPSHASLMVFTVLF